MTTLVLTWLLAAAGGAPASAVPVHHPFTDRVLEGLAAAPEKCRRRLAARFGHGAAVDCALPDVKTREWVENWRRSFPDDLAAPAVRPLGDWMESLGGWWRRYYEVDGVPVVIAYGGKQRGLFVAYYESLPRSCPPRGPDVARAGADGVSFPERIEEPWTEAVYPAAARRRRLDGMVMFSALIDRDGTTRDLCLIDVRPRGWGFEQAAIESLETVRYRPALREGRPVASTFTVVRLFDAE